MGKSFKVGRYGQTMSDEFCLGNDATVDDAIATAGFTVEKGETLAIDGETVKGSYEFEDCDKIFIAPSTSGANL